MKAIEQTHPVTGEELMAYLDGELSADASANVHAHLMQCAACQRLAADLRQVSRDLASWEVANRPASLSAPVLPAPVPRAPLWRLSWLRPSTAAWALAAVAVTLLFVNAQYSLAPRSRMVLSDAASRPDADSGEKAEPSEESLRSRGLVRQGGSRLATAPAERQEQPGRADAAVRTPKIIRTVTMHVVAKAFDDVRPALDRLLRDVNGFIGQMQASDAGASQRSLTATLRVPAARLDDTVRALRALGHVADESQSGDDVTEQVQDLEARLANSRNTERRLSDVLNNRTGRLTDILEVEREIARVRGEIERMEAERVNLERRVTYATVSIHVTEQRQATLGIGPQPVSTRLRNAFVDGLRDAVESAIDTVLLLLRVAPVLLFWAAVLWWPGRVLYRRVRSRTA
jgi:hypothetical protein